MLRIPLPWHPKSPSVRLSSPSNSTVATSLTGGTEISLQEAVDLLHKLREESAQVQAIYAGSGGVSSVLRGILRHPIDDGPWSIVSQCETAGSALSFDLLWQRREGSVMNHPCWVRLHFHSAFVLHPRSV